MLRTTNQGERRIGISTWIKILRKSKVSGVDEWFSGVLIRYIIRVPICTDYEAEVRQNSVINS